MLEIGDAELPRQSFTEVWLASSPILHSRQKKNKLGLLTNGYLGSLWTKPSLSAVKSTIFISNYATSNNNHTSFFTLVLWKCRHKPHITDKERSCVHSSWVTNITAGGNEIKTMSIQYFSFLFYLFCWTRCFTVMITGDLKYLQIHILLSVSDICAYYKQKLR